MTRIRVALAVAGTVVMAYALVGSLLDPDFDPVGVLIFLVAVLIGHDGVLMPVVLGAGLLIARFVPVRRRTVARIAAISAAAVTAVAAPLILGPGSPADNPSALPLAYGRNLLIVLAVIAAAAVVGLIRRARTGRAGGE